MQAFCLLTCTYSSHKTQTFILPSLSLWPDPIHQMGMSFEHPPSEATKTSMTSQNSQEDSYHSTQDDHLTKLKAHQFYLLHVHLKQGFDLAARDSNGSSDPYVKFVYKGKVVHKSKTVHKDLNPLWDEQFVLPIDDPFQPVVVKVRQISFIDVPHQRGLAKQD